MFNLKRTCGVCGRNDKADYIRFKAVNRGGRNQYVCTDCISDIKRDIKESPVVGALPKGKDIITELFVSVSPVDDAQKAALLTKMEERQGTVHVSTHNPKCRAVIAHDAKRPSMKAPVKLVSETLPSMGFDKVNNITAVFTFGGGKFTAVYSTKQFMPELRSNPHEWLLQAEHSLCKRLHIANRSALSTGTRKK